MTYNDKVVRQFTVATVLWGIVGMLVGVLIAAQLWLPALNFDLPWLTYSRLRPLHTNAVIFAFGGSALIGTSFYVVQRTCHVTLFAPKLASFVFWGWQLVILAAAISLPMGWTQSKEYAELEWPIDILITIVWVAYAVVFFGTIVKRRVSHIYVANWFYAAFIITIALLHIVNNLSLPVTMTKSYEVYTGAVDAMVQWWYGHNAVGFFLTAGFLGMMYYFVPKQAERPVFSYKLSIVHFWALIFLYIWAGPHHLHYTALPDWASTLGMVFSVILWMPSWGGMINGLMTLSGAWDKLRTDPILRFLVVSLSFYGMSTFEGPMMSIKTVNALSHYTDWTIGHVHSGALGLVAPFWRRDLAARRALVELAAALAAVAHWRDPLDRLRVEPAIDQPAQQAGLFGDQRGLRIEKVDRPGDLEAAVHDDFTVDHGVVRVMTISAEKQGGQWIRE